MKDPRRLGDRRMRHARCDQLLGNVALVEAGREELHRWRLRGRIPLDVYLEILEEEADAVRDEMTR